jgi:hypothetical protein
MKALLQEYLVEHHTLPLPGIGVLQAQPQPAIYDVADRSFQQPKLQIDFTAFEEGESFPLQHLIGFIAVKKNVAEEDAFEMLQQYASDASAQLHANARLSWLPIGTFIKNNGTDITFQIAELVNGFAPLDTERVIREGASHNMMVGDTETTTTQMEAYLAETEEATDRWWLLPVLIALGAVALIVWHYASSGN